MLRGQVTHSDRHGRAHILLVRLCAGEADLTAVVRVRGSPAEPALQLGAARQCPPVGLVRLSAGILPRLRSE